jgi:hypothetical protein
MRALFRNRSTPQRCAICHDDARASALVPCERCGSAAHEDCRRELGRCSSLGCSQPIRATASLAVVVEPARLAFHEPGGWRLLLGYTGACLVANVAYHGLLHLGAALGGFPVFLLIVATLPCHLAFIAAQRACSTKPQTANDRAFGFKTNVRRWGSPPAWVALFVIAVLAALLGSMYGLMDAPANVQRLETGRRAVVQESELVGPALFTLVLGGYQLLVFVCLSSLGPRRAAGGR